MVAQIPLLLPLHLGGVRPPLGINNAWQIKQRQDQAPPLCIKTEQGTHHKE